MADVNAIKYKKSHYYDSNSNLIRQINDTYLDYSGGGINWKHMAWFLKNDNDEYKEIVLPQTDELYYHYRVFDGTENFLWKYTDENPDEFGNAYLDVSTLYQVIQKQYKRKTTTSESTYRSLSTDLNTLMHSRLEIWFWTGIIGPIHHNYHVNMYSNVSPNSFKDMPIIRQSDGTFNVRVGGTVGIKNINYNAYSNNLIWYENNNVHEIPRDLDDNSFMVNSSNGNQTYSFDSLQLKGYYKVGPGGVSNPDNYTYYTGDDDEQAFRTFTWPSYCTINFKKFDKPTISIINDKVVNWNISQTDYVQNGYAVYFDNVYYVTTKETSLQIPDKYRLGNHKVSIKVLANNKTVNLGDYSAAWYDTNKGRVVDYTKETVVAFIDSDEASMNYKGTLSKPYVNISEKIAVNKYAVAWEIVDFAEGYETKLDGNNIINTNNRVEATVSQGSHTITIKAYKIIDGVKYESEITTVEFFMPKINKPTNISFTKNLADGGSVFWSKVDDADSYGDIKEYTLLVNGIEYQTNGNTYTLKDLAIGTNSLSIRSNFGIDTTYNSDYADYTFTDPNIIRKLSTPTLIAEEIHDTTTNGVVALKLSWKPVSYASGYVLDDYYEVYNDESGLWTGTHIEDDQIETEKTIKFNIGQGVGKHTYTVKAYYKEFINDFTSDYSTTPEKGIIEVSKLKPITGLKWKSYDTKKHRDESTLLWNKVKDENYYRVFALKDGETGELDSKGYVIKTDGAQTKFSFDILNMSVINNQLSTANYDIYIRCYNYDTLYYQPSEISNRLVYDVIQLDPPTGLAFDNNTQTLSWNKVNMATSYIVYKVGEPNPITETKELSYTFPDLGAGFFKFYVIAKRTVMEEE